MLRDGHEISRRNTGYSYRRNRSGISASRKRNRAERRRDGQALRALLAACGTFTCRRREDVQVGGELLHAARFVREGLQAFGFAVCLGRRSLPQATQFHFRWFAASG